MTSRCLTENGCLANHPKIYIQHVKSGQSVAFPAFLTKLSDKYEARWNEESVYGRMDPIATYQRTQRVIDLSWQVISTSEAEARSNMKMISDLVNFHYPSYMGAGNSNLIQSPPLLRIRFDPFIRKGKNGALLGYTKGVDVSPNIDEGFIFNDLAANRDMMPKELEISLSFTVLHEHDLGFKGKKRQNPQFPYGRFNGPCVDQSNPYRKKKQQDINVVAKETAAQIAIGMSMAIAMGLPGDPLPIETESEEFNDRLNLLPKGFAEGGPWFEGAGEGVDKLRLRNSGKEVAKITKRANAHRRRVAAEKRQEKRRERIEAAQRAKAERRRQVKFRKWDRKETRKREKEGKEIIERAKSLEKFSREARKFK